MRRIYFKADDIFEHFKMLASAKKTPSFEELEEHARAVYRTFCTHHSAERALDPVADAPDDDEEEHPNTRRWKASVPLGSPWDPTPVAFSMPSDTSPAVDRATSSGPMPVAGSEPTLTLNQADTGHQSLLPGMVTDSSVCSPSSPMLVQTFLRRRQTQSLLPQPQRRTFPALTPPVVAPVAHAKPRPPPLRVRLMKHFSVTAFSPMPSISMRTSLWYGSSCMLCRKVMQGVCMRQ